MGMWIIGLLQWAHAVTVDRIAAVVNNEVITLSEVYEVGGEYIAASVSMAPKELRRAELEVLDTLVLRSLVTQELRNMGMDVTEDELRAAYEDIAKSNNLTVETLQQEVEGSGIPWDAYQEEIKQSLRQMKFNQLILQPRIIVDDNALQQQYRELKQQQPEVVDLYGIFIKNPLPLRSAEEVAAGGTMTVEEASALIEKTKKQQAEEQAQKLDQITKDVQNGVPFADLAKKYDQSGLASAGGKMGTFAQGKLRADIDQIAFSLEPMKISDPLSTNNGVYLLYVGAKYKQDPPPFDTVKPQLLDAFYADKFETELHNWYTIAKSRAALDIRLQDYPVFSTP